MTLELPIYSVDDAGLSWLKNPFECKTKLKDDWEKAMAFLVSWGIALVEVIALAHKQQNETVGKAARDTLLRVEKQQSAVQSMLKSMGER
jgi:hypothetical protein